MLTKVQLSLKGCVGLFLAHAVGVGDELVDDGLHAVAQLLRPVVVLLDVRVLRHDRLLLAVADDRLLVDLLLHHQPANITQRHDITTPCLHAASRYEYL